MVCFVTVVILVDLANRCQRVQFLSESVFEKKKRIEGQSGWPKQ